MRANLLHYRPWQGELGGSFRLVWPIARTSLTMILSRKAFWVIYVLSLTLFFMFFFGQYLLAWAETQAADSAVPILGFREPPKVATFIDVLKNRIKLNGSADTYQRFINLQGAVVMIVLAMAGSILVGNDFRFGSLPFYLSKPLSRWHYLFGKCLAVGVFVNLLTTLPALVLFVQYGMLDESYAYFRGPGTVLEVGDYFWTLPVNPLLFGILGYGLLLTLCLSLMLVATAIWLRKTVPLIMAWTTLFVFLPSLTRGLVEQLQYSPRWRLFDLWHDMFLVGSHFLGVQFSPGRVAVQPDWREAAFVLGAACTLCLIYLNLRIRAVEVVR